MEFYSLCLGEEQASKQFYLPFGAGCWKRTGDPDQHETGDGDGYEDAGEGCLWEAGRPGVSAAAAGWPQGSQAWTCL